MCSAYCSLFDAHTGEPLCRDQASEDAAYLAASRLLLGAKLGHRGFHRTPSSSQPPSPTSIPQECDESRDRCTFSDPILISSFAPDSSEASLLQKTASCERALATKSAHLAWLAFRREVVRRRAAYIKSIALLDPECPILKLRREDLLPELETLESTLSKLATERDVLVAELEFAIQGMQECHRSCLHALDVNNGVAAELHQVGVFSAATKKLILCDILTELGARISRYGFPSATPNPSLTPLKPWNTLIAQYKETRSRQETIYAAQHHAVSSVASKPQRSASDNLISASQTSFHLASPIAPAIPQRLPFIVPQRASSDSAILRKPDSAGSSGSSEDLLRRRASAVIASAGKKRYFEDMSSSSDADLSAFPPRHSTCMAAPEGNNSESERSRIQSTPVSAEGIIVFVKETEEEVPLSSQESRTTVGSCNEGAPTNLEGEEECVASSQRAQEDASFEDYGSSVFSAVQYEGHQRFQVTVVAGVIVDGEESDVALSAEGVTSSVAVQPPTSARE